MAAADSIARITSRAPKLIVRAARARAPQQRRRVRARAQDAVAVATAQYKFPGHVALAVHTCPGIIFGVWLNGSTKADVRTANSLLESFTLNPAARGRLATFTASHKATFIAVLAKAPGHADEETKSMQVRAARAGARARQFADRARARAQSIEAALEPGRFVSIVTSYLADPAEYVVTILAAAAKVAAAGHLPLLVVGENTYRRIKYILDVAHGLPAEGAKAPLAAAVPVTDGSNTAVIPDTLCAKMDVPEARSRVLRALDAFTDAAVTASRWRAATRLAAAAEEEQEEEEEAEEAPTATQAVAAADDEEDSDVQEVAAPVPRAAAPSSPAPKTPVTSSPMRVPPPPPAPAASPASKTTPRAPPAPPAGAFSIFEGLVRDNARCLVDCAADGKDVQLSENSIRSASGTARLKWSALCDGVRAANGGNEKYADMAVVGRLLVESGILDAGVLSKLPMPPPETPARGTGTPKSVAPTASGASVAAAPPAGAPDFFDRHPLVPAAAASTPVAAHGRKIPSTAAGVAGSSLVSRAHFFVRPLARARARARARSPLHTHPRARAQNHVFPEALQCVLATPGGQQIAQFMEPVWVTVQDTLRWLEIARSRRAAALSVSVVPGAAGSLISATDYTFLRELCGAAGMRVPKELRGGGGSGGLGGEGPSADLSAGLPAGVPDALRALVADARLLSAGDFLAALGRAVPCFGALVVELQALKSTDGVGRTHLFSRILPAQSELVDYNIALPKLPVVGGATVAAGAPSADATRLRELVNATAAAAARILFARPDGPCADPVANGLLRWCMAAAGTRARARARAGARHSSRRHLLRSGRACTQEPRRRWRRRRADGQRRVRAGAHPGADRRVSAGALRPGGARGGAPCAAHGAPPHGPGARWEHVHDEPGPAAIPPGCEAPEGRGG